MSSPLDHIQYAPAPPSTVPEEIGQHFIDTAAKNVYLSVGTDDIEDWILVGGRDLGARFESDGTLAIKNRTSGEYHEFGADDMPNGEGVTTYVEQTGNP